MCVHGEAARWWGYGASPHVGVRPIEIEALFCLGRHLLSWHIHCRKRLSSQSKVLAILIGASSSTRMSES